LTRGKKFEKDPPILNETRFHLNFWLSLKATITRAQGGKILKTRFEEEGKLSTKVQMRAFSLNFLSLINFFNSTRLIHERVICIKNSAILLAPFFLFLKVKIFKQEVKDSEIRKRKEYKRRDLKETSL